MVEYSNFTLIYCSVSAYEAVDFGLTYFHL